MVGLRKEQALILAAITVIAFTVMLNVGNVYAIPPQTLILTPNPVTQSTASVQVTGAGFAANDNNIQISLLSASCSIGGTQIFTTTASSDAGGNLNPVTIPTAGLSPGTYCVTVVDTTTLGTDLTVIPAAIPEYPFGLPLLAIFLVIAYGLIRRRTRN